MPASVGVAGWTQYRAETDRLSLLDREARVATAEERVDAYGDDIAAVKEDLNRRMEFLEVIGEALPEDLKVAGSVSESATEAAETVEKVSAAFPEAAALARIEARQLALVEGLTQYADWRSQRAAALASWVSNRGMIRNAERGAMGGPRWKASLPIRTARSILGSNAWVCRSRGWTRSSVGSRACRRSPPRTSA